MRLYTLCVYLFLYTPIAIIALFSFNAGRHASQMEGFSTQWYGRALKNPFVMDALETSLLVAFVSATLAAVFGTMAAVALQGMRGPVRTLFDALIYIAVMIPGIVIGIATLIALVTVFDQVNPALAALWPEGAEPPVLSMGIGSLISAHTMFTMALVIIIVRARLTSLETVLTEAAADLYATPFGTFRQVTLPLIAPAILAGFLLAFTFSFDDFIIAFFVAGSETTLPIYVFSSIRRGVTPEINAIGTMVLVASLILLIIAQLILRRGDKK
ncbi:MAG: ABC transporter permease [Pseudomonadota bacterium]